MGNRALWLLVYFVISSPFLWASVQPKLVYSGSALQKRISFTFDDGPKSEVSKQLLDVLKKHHIRATFMVVGKECLLNPEIVIRMKEEGHDVENHSFSHLRLDTLSDSQIELELKSTNDIIQDLTGKLPIYFRPPGGRYTERVSVIAAKENLSQLMWDVNTGDYSLLIPEAPRKTEADIQSQGTLLLDRVMSHVKNGSIILMHNGSIETVRALPRIIKALQDKEFEIVPVSELTIK